MGHDKKIYGRIVRKNATHPGYWDILELRAGVPTGRVTYTGTLKDVRKVLKNP